MLQALVITLLLIVAAELVSSATGSRWPMALLVTLLLLSGAARVNWQRDVVQPYRHIRPRHLGIGLLALALPLTSFLLTADVPWLAWSLLSFVSAEEGNVIAAGLDLGLLFAIPYVLLLLAVLPTLALVEEYWFRRGTRGWADGLVRSVGFGLAHMIVGVPLGVALFGLSGVGLLFTGIYLRASRAPRAGDALPGFATDRLKQITPAERRGIEAAALQHLAYNVVVLLLTVTAMFVGILVDVE